MKWAEISIATTHEATEAVANIFHDVGASGVVIEDPQLVNTYRQAGIWDYCGIPEELDLKIVTVKAYLPSDDELNERLSTFKERIDELVTHDLDKGLGTIACKEVQEEDWDACWKDYFHPIRVGERIVIKPSWEEYEALENDIVVELDPGMAFGTGTHYTTTMCISCIEQIVKPEDIVFDIGTGSGILAVIAAKMGAAKVLAVDFDSVAVRVAKENVEMNQVGDIVTVAQGDLFTGITGKADVIIANIVADVIIRLLPQVDMHLNPHGVLVASGIIADRMSDVTVAVLENGLLVEKVVEEGEWVAMRIRKGGA